MHLHLLCAVCVHLEPAPRLFPAPKFAFEAHPIRVVLRALSMLHIIVPLAHVATAILVIVEAFARALIVLELALVAVTIQVENRAVPVAETLKHVAFVAIAIVQIVNCAIAMLLVIFVFAFITA